MKRKNFGKKKFTTAHTLKLSPSLRGKEQASDIPEGEESAPPPLSRGSGERAAKTRAAANERPRSRSGSIPLLANAAFALRKGLRVADGTILVVPRGLGRRTVQQAVRDTGTNPRLRVLGSHPRGVALRDEFAPEVPRAAKEIRAGESCQNVQPSNDP